MPKIRLELDRLESYALLAASEYLRQLISEGKGVPAIRTISPLSANTSYTEVEFDFDFNRVPYALLVRVDAGDIWPKKGTARLTRRDTGAGEVRHDFELRGSPAEPRVVFTRMRGGG